MRWDGSGVSWCGVGGSWRGVGVGCLERGWADLLGLGLFAEDATGVWGRCAVAAATAIRAAGGMGWSLLGAGGEGVLGGGLVGEGGWGGGLYGCRTAHGGGRRYLSSWVAEK